MSWQVKHRKKDDKYRLWTTISDGWLTNWLSRDEMIEAISGEYQEEVSEKVEKLRLTFPNGWTDTEGERFQCLQDDRYMSEADWHKHQYEKLTK